MERAYFDHIHGDAFEAVGDALAGAALGSGELFGDRDDDGDLVGGLAARFFVADGDRDDVMHAEEGALVAALDAESFFVGIGRHNKIPYGHGVSANGLRPLAQTPT